MAISMSGATIDTSERDSLLSSTVDFGVTSGGASANTVSAGGTFRTGAILAGVTPEFAAHVSAEIDTYEAEVNALLDHLQDANSEVAFKGEAVKAALTQFIDSVREVSKSYMAKLKAAEQQIVNSVQTAYSTQDADLSGDMNSDASTLDSQRPM